MIPIKYNVRSLFARSGTTLMTVLSIAFVVLVYIGVLALAGGLGAAFKAAGDETTVIVLRDGARSEMESGYALDTQRILAALPGIATDERGEPLVSGEAFHIQILEKLDGNEANVPIRAVSERAFAIRPQVRIAEGRQFEKGQSEVVVGKQIANRYGLGLGSEIKLGRNPFRVVGVLDSGGGALESEIWGDATEIGDTYRRSNYVSSVRIRVPSKADIPAMIDRISADQRLQVEAIPETTFFERQTEGSTALFIILGNALAVLMAFGACFAAANTMYAQVAARSREIGTLRALGFKRRSILSAFVIEALVLGLAAGLLGALLSLPLNGFTTGTMNQAAFSEVSFALRTTPPILLGGVMLATFTALIGGLLPAISASRQPITSLLRST